MYALKAQQLACRPPSCQQVVARPQQAGSVQKHSSRASSRSCSAFQNQQQELTAFVSQLNHVTKQQLQKAQLPSQPHSSSTGSNASSRRSMLGMLTAAAAAVLLSSADPQPAAAAAAVTSSNALEEYMKLEDAGKLRDQRSLENIRGKYNIKRTIDGRVQLRRKGGNWMSVRLDMEVPGAILLRDMKTEAIYALETDGLPQVDLSDDYVLFMMFADGAWENDMTPIEFEEDTGQSKQLTMTEKEFHEFVGLLKEPDEEPAQRRK